jgi:hypothetical protein
MLSNVPSKRMQTVLLIAAAVCAFLALLFFSL